MYLPSRHPRAFAHSPPVQSHSFPARVPVFFQQYDIRIILHIVRRHDLLGFTEQTFAGPPHTPFLLGNRGLSLSLHCEGRICCNDTCYKRKSLGITQLSHNWVESEFVTRVALN